jgi:hypothetical protein
MNYFSAQILTLAALEKVGIFGIAPPISYAVITEVNTDMASKSHASNENRSHRLPAGFVPGARGLAGEYAHELGWGTNEDERRKSPSEKQEFDGGKDYDYGPRDFGDTAVDTSSAKTDSMKTPVQQTRASHASHSPSSHSQPAKDTRASQNGGQRRVFVAHDHSHDQANDTAKHAK